MFISLLPAQITGLLQAERNFDWHRNSATLSQSTWKRGCAPSNSTTASQTKPAHVHAALGKNTPQQSLLTCTQNGMKGDFLCAGMTQARTKTKGPHVEIPCTHPESNAAFAEGSRFASWARGTNPSQASAAHSRGFPAFQI